MNTSTVLLLFLVMKFCVTVRGLSVLIPNQYSFSRIRVSSWWAADNGIQNYHRAVSLNYQNNGVAACHEQDASFRTIKDSSAPIPLLILFRGVLNTEIRIAEFRAIVEKDYGKECAARIFFSSAINTPLAQNEEHLYHGPLNNHAYMADAFLTVEGLTVEQAARTAAQAMLVKAVYRPLAQGPSLAACAARLSLSDDEEVLPEQGHGEGCWGEVVAAPGPRHQEEQRAPSWAVELVPLAVGEDCRTGAQEPLKRAASTADMAKKIDSFGAFLDRLPGPVRLKNPDITFAIIEELENFAVADRRLKQVTFAKRIAVGAEDRLPKFSLSTRAFTGSTSMKPRMAFIMCSLAGVGQGCKVLDPYVGSGSILLSAAALGASLTAGVDINPAMVKIADENTSVILGPPVMADAFFEQSLCPPALLVCGDAGAEETASKLLPLGPFDAIVTDPPYGKREGGLQNNRDDLTSEAFKTLLRLFQRDGVLKVNGKATFMMPLPKSDKDFCIGLVNQHHNLRVREMISDNVNSDLHRWIIVVEKTGGVYNKLHQRS